jgi:hypothetical protein
MYSAFPWSTRTLDINILVSACLHEDQSLLSTELRFAPIWLDAINIFTGNNDSEHKTYSTGQAGPKEWAKARLWTLTDNILFFSSVYAKNKDASEAD